MVIYGMQNDTGHPTRTLTFDRSGMWLYVSIGSFANVDNDSSRARIRRFNIANWNSTAPFNFHVDGELFADGLCNEVGLAWDSFGDLWGVENGADRILTIIPLRNCIVSVPTKRWVSITVTPIASVNIVFPLPMVGQV